jgi:hypothetical protein
MLAAKTCAAIVVVAALVAGCSSGDSCGGEAVPPSATFELSCDSTDLTSVTVSGPCETDAGTSFYRWEGDVIIDGPPTAGVCHVELTFATGFTYVTDVNYTVQPVLDCNGHTTDDYLAPTQVTFAVNNPSATCVDAGSDAGRAGATGLDAASGPGIESGIDGAPDSGDEG